MPLTPATRDRLTAGIARLLRSGRHVSARAADAVHGDLPSFGWALLAPLERDGEQRCSALAAQVGVDVSVASRQVAALERSGLVERRPDPHDGRASLIGLTPAGSAAIAQTRAVRSEWAAEALAGWTEEEAARLGDLLERLAADLDRAAVPRPHAGAPA
ncbi:MarR family winged helix-turn-helix transcriptional regulator [Geodermatophilus nigrescens]|uniref:Transcriptional regulator, MarR family n=1 Tax=Geodermatophilus nigrescens TaxID=1070870 RepID=A0A1M5M2N5_9ACTN|nr:MarR family transcriptional regulator [Geodermatophilus nigrescens]SHG71490.1 transcriptional regulator, MarR family [Geodermatophilus nigrescens]